MMEYCIYCWPWQWQFHENMKTITQREYEAAHLRLIQTTFFCSSYFFSAASTHFPTSSFNGWPAKETDAWFCLFGKQQFCLILNCYWLLTFDLWNHLLHRLGSLGHDASLGLQQSRSQSEEVKSDCASIFIFLDSINFICTSLRVTDISV